MKGLARGRLEDRHVVVEDEADANRLYNKGLVGTPQTGNALRLSLPEAAHAVAHGRLEVGGHDLAGLLAVGAEGGERTEVEYLAYADLRDRGLVVRHDPGAFLAWRRAEGPPQDPWFRFHAVSERQAVACDDLLGWADEGAVVGVVDEDGAVTHYRLHAARPAGSVPQTDLPRLDGIVLDDRVLVPGDGAVRALAREGVGTPHADAAVLSFTEAEALRRRGVLDVPGDLPERAAARQHHFPRTLPVYEALRAAGVVARSGFRFGTHLRGYRDAPDEGHAEWLVHCAEAGDRLHWPEISRGVRLAHGVRKTFLVGVAGPPVRFAAIEWFRP